MEPTLTLAAAWLNSALAPFDFTILAALHTLAAQAGFLFTPLFTLIGLVGEKGACFFALSVLLMFFKRTRAVGVCMFIAICLGALATNIILKDLIERPRPFETSAIFADWWRFAGASPEDGFSFPSGHATAAAAAMGALALTRPGWKTTFGGLIVVATMCASRCYLMVHYPTDVLAGCLVGAAAAALAYLAVKQATNLLKRSQQSSRAPQHLHYR